MTEPKSVACDPFAGGGSTHHGALPAQHWIHHPIADEGLRRLQELYDSPRSHRTPGMLIFGDSNNGKTLLALRFQKTINRAAPPVEDGQAVPVIYVQSPPGPDLGGLYSAILRSVNAPFAATARLQRKQDQIISLLPQLGTRMLIIDELHNILVGMSNHQATFLNGLKYLSNELQIPIVTIGTNEARAALQLDQQLGNRFRAFHMPRWNPDKEYAKFVIQTFLAFELDAQPLVKLVRSLQELHTLTGGLTGETWSLARAVAARCVAEGRDTVELETVQATDWLPPEERRR